MTMLGKDHRQFFHEDYMQDNEFYQTEKKIVIPNSIFRFNLYLQQKP